MADLLGGSTVGGYLVESTKGSQEKANKALADAKTYADGKSTALEAILANKADSASPTFTGTPAAPTASAGTNTTQLATTAFVTTAVNNKTSITGNAGSATKLATARTISLGGDVTGSASFDGSGNITITATVVDDSHNHVIGDVDGLQTALDNLSKNSVSSGEADLNTHTVAGLFYIPIARTNSPIATGGHLQVISMGGTQVQQVFTSATSVRMFSRLYTGSAWTAWVELTLTNKTVVDQLSDNGGQLNYKGAAIGNPNAVSKTGDDMNGKLNFNTTNGRLVIPVGTDKYAT